MELCARVDLEEMISNVDICTLVFLGEMITSEENFSKTLEKTAKSTPP